MPDQSDERERGGRRTVNVALVGHGFMGAAHSQAWRTVAHAFDVDPVPRMAVLCGRDRGNAAAAAARWGWAASADDWRAVVADPAVDVVDICTPSRSHAEIAAAALAAGKHVLCEKPLANTVAEAARLAGAARIAAARSGAVALLGFNYRRVPAVALARGLVEHGRLGRVRHVRARYLQDWLADPHTPLTWRLDAAEAGSGALGDIGSHIIDLAQYLTGHRITDVFGCTHTFTTERPGADGTPGPVTVDDAAVLTARMANGALATFEVSRAATGRKNSLRIEIDGTDGALAFDLERLNELEFLDATAPRGEQGFRTLLATEPDHPYLAAWWPPGHVLGWEHTFTHQARDLLTAIGQGTGAAPDFTDGLGVQLVLDAALRSAASGTWQHVPDTPPDPGSPT
ncbi:Gfo/Idh/MocA family protein [Yinghuangia seranimata]|uniref:Gfo/Idh/MocA family protein n=1 Tax=Yinghuangia seranimata TaxID=408067 RepID=UPI00248AE317|nr:Gfo/Idh/MocA family oxidoreductase [Yinghuangia seranimata]MDI2125617.1 Gfo/Idh/MocA family oxidoreductase [Yinghuangia seranimata]